MQPVRSTDGVTVALHDLGGEPGAPVLLLGHATGFPGRGFEPMAGAGLAAHYRCVAPDFRGHGDSVVASDLDYAWRGFADDVLAVIDHLSPTGQPLHAFGHSMGGAALLMAEARRPGSFAALFLYEPVVPPPDRVVTIEGATPGDNPLAAGAERRNERFESYDAAIANFAAKPPLEVFTPEAMSAYVHGGFAQQPDGSVRLKCRGRVEAQVYRMAAVHDAFEHLGEVRCPVTIASGHAEGFGPSAFAPSVAERLPRGRLVRFEGLGHFGPMQAPAVLAAAVIEAFA